MDRFRLVIPPTILDDVIGQARAEFPNECCGLLAGELVDGVGTVTLRLPLTNTAASGTEYTADVRELFVAQKRMRAVGVRELAVYHSHPTAAAVPSRADIERNGYGESVVHLIVGTDGVRGWWLTADGFAAAEVSDGERPASAGR